MDLKNKNQRGDRVSPSLWSFAAAALLFFCSWFVFLLLQPESDPPTLPDLTILYEEDRLQEAQDGALALARSIERRNDEPGNLDLADALDLVLACDYVTEALPRQRALELARRTVAIRSALQGISHPATLNSRRNLALAFLSVDLRNEAEAILRDVLTSRKLLLGEDHPLVAQSLTDLSFLPSVWVSEGLGKHLAQAAIILETASPNSRELARTLYQHALWEATRTMGIALARKRLAQSLSILEEKAPSSFEMAMALSVFSWFSSTVGDLSSAQHFVSESAKILAQLAPQSVWYAEALSGVGNCHERRGNYSAAREYYNKSMQFLQRRRPLDSRSSRYQWSARGRLAYLDYCENRLEEAKKVYLEMLNLPRAMANHHAVRTMLGSISARSGDLASAEEFIRKAYEFSSRNSRSATVALDLTHWSQLRFAQGFSESGLAKATEAESLGRALLYARLKSISTAQAFRQVIWRPGGIDSMLNNLEQLQQLEGGVFSLWDAIVQVRGAVMREMLDRAELARQNRWIAQDLRLHAVQKKRRDLAHQLMQSDDALQERLELDEAEQRLALATEPLRREKPPPGLAEVSEALPEKTSLVAFARYPRHQLPLDALHVAPDEMEPAYFGFILPEPGASPVAFRVGTERQIRPMVAALRRSLACEANPVCRGPQSEARYLDAAAQIEDKIWKPVLKHLGDVQKIFVVPDGVLNYVNLHALPSDSGGYLVDDGYVFHYLNAERDLLRFSRRNTQKTGGLLALGGPLFDRGDASPLHDAQDRILRGKRGSLEALRAGKFEPLPHSLREVQKIVQTWNRAEREPALQLLEAKAVESEFVRHAEGKRILHLATHSLTVTGGESAMAPTLRSMGGIASSGGWDRLITETNPLRLSGLAFSGLDLANPSPRAEEDNLLTTHEILNLDLSAVEWGVLSACDTGHGELQYGEGIWGLRWAFQAAGVNTVIASLWPVEDEATRVWMEELYTARFDNKLSTWEAVAQANRKALLQRRLNGQSTHPFYWGAFVAMGDWR